MSWLIIALIAYFLLAIVNVADKFIIEKVVTGARAYTLLVSGGGLLIFLLAPWFLQWPGGQLFLFDLMVGAAFTVGLLFMYTALDDSEASKIFTLVGGVVPVLVTIFSWLFFKEDFSFYQLLGIAFLVLGTVVISQATDHHSIWFRVREWFTPARDSKQARCLALALVAALFFAFFWVGTKYVYDTQSFFSGLSWIKLGGFLAAILLLLRREDRREIKSDLQRTGRHQSNRFIFLGDQILVGVGGILQNYAVALGSVALVTSLQGVQYGLLLIFTFFLTMFKPKIIKENESRPVVMRKILAIILIALGLYFLMAFK
jgi:drug/metabolite transporter (DMT)-like permease